MERKWVFEGIKVVDFTQGATGGLATKYLADNGATVVHIESRVRPDVNRVVGPFKDNVPSPDTCALFPSWSTSKLGITLNLNHPEAKDILWKLIMWGDLLVESFSPGVMKNWGFDYENVKKKRPDIIYTSSCQMGQYGPWAHFRGYGTHGAFFAGFPTLLGWPDRPPSWFYVPHNDWISFRTLAVAIIAALAYRRKTGKGQYIDQAQMEAAAHELAPVLMDYTVNGRIQERDGNRYPGAAPHGAYPCRGEDRWVTIAVTTDEEWKAFCKVIGEPAWVRNLKFTTLLARKENEDELNQLVAEWTIHFSSEEVMTWMQTAGVPAGVVENSEDLFNDPQLQYRGHWVTLDHPRIGPHSFDAAAFKLSKTPMQLRWAGPTLGQHNEYVYKEILGMSDEEIANHLIKGVFE